MTAKRPMRVLAVLLISWLGVACGSGGSEPEPPLARRAPRLELEAGAGGSFGRVLTMSGGVLAVGSPRESPGVVQLYRRGPGGWSEDGLIQGEVDDGGFGRFLALRGDALAVGQPEVEGSGIVWIYRRTAAGWALEDALRPPAGTPTSFGAALAFDGDALFVGAPGGPEGGEVVVFTRPGHWRLAARLTPRERTPYDGFGYVLAADGGTLVVGVPWTEPTSAPSAVVFHRARLGWVEVDRLFEPATEEEPAYSSQVAVQGGVLVVACGCPDGEVYVYERRLHRWVLVATLQAPWEDVLVGMAHDLALSPGGQFLAVTAHRATVDGLEGVGEALVYRRGHGGWRLERTLTPPAPEPGASFGHAVAMGQDLVVIGAPGTAASGGQVFTFSLAHR